MNITVYCGAAEGNKPEYRRVAENVGKWIAEKDNTLVYGGGNIGLMKKVADSVLANNGKAIGVMPEFLVNKEISHGNLTELIIVKDMHERKKKMIELGDAFVALPGGPGTLEEITEVISASRLELHNNPCIFYNQNGIYDNIYAQYKTMTEEGFMTDDMFKSILLIDDINGLDKVISEYRPPEVRNL